MSPKTLGLVGILFLVAAAVVAALNLKRVADLKMLWVSPILLIFGIALLARARRQGK